MSLVQEEHFCGKVAQKAIIIKEDKVLLIRDPREKNDIWELPGGRLNVGELPIAGLQRELREELGVEVEVGAVIYVGQFLQVSEGKTALLLVYLATLTDSELPLVLDPLEIAEASFVSVEEALARKLFPEYRRAIEVYKESLS